MADAIDGKPIIIIRTMGGEEVRRFDDIPDTMLSLKQMIAKSGVMPVALQKLLHEDSLSVCLDDEVLDVVSQTMLLVQDDTPLWYWDIQEDHSPLEIDGNVVRCPDLLTDYTNVITKEPIDKGLHFFEFHMHCYMDEQWCGLTPDKNMVGSSYGVAIPSKTGWMYYTGRNRAALEAVGYHLKDFKFVERQSGSIIGMLVDCDNGAVAFDLNGEIQGSCEIPKNKPLWVLTHLDTRKDHVELRKPHLQDAPPANFDALKGALLDVSQGTEIMRSY